MKAIAEHAVATYDGPVSIDRYGRRVPKPATGSIALPEPTSATSRICDAVDKLFLSIVDRRLLVRRVNVVAADVLARNLFSPYELPVGIFTALIGVPCFLWLYGRGGRP